MQKVDNTQAPIKTKAEIKQLQYANIMASLVLQELAPHIQPGKTISQLNYIAGELIKKYELKIDRLGSSQISAKDGEGVVDFSSIMALSFGHNDSGFYRPVDNTELKHGDLLITDCSILKNGWSGDVSKTWIVGQDSSFIATRLVYTIYQACWLGISLCKPGAKLSDIASSIERYVESQNFKMLKFSDEWIEIGAGCGHSIGRIHNDGWAIPYFSHPINEGRVLEEGMTIAVEPIITAGNGSGIVDDNFHGRTEDGSLCAHWEHIVAITSDGCDVLSLRSGTDGDTSMVENALT